MFHRLSITLAAAAALLSCAGCIVTSSTYETKAREVDALRDGYASLNREKSKLSSENAVLAQQVAVRKAEVEALNREIAERDESLRRMRDELAAIRSSTEGTRLTREQFINELLEKEKATGKRMQELSSRADACAGELTELKKKMEAKEALTAR